jgi:hypothetical protein
MNRFKFYRYCRNFGQQLQTGEVSVYGFGTIFVATLDKMLTTSQPERERERERERLCDLFLTHCQTAY